MDQLYSITLLVALTAGTLGTGAGLAALRPRSGTGSGSGSGTGAGRLALGCALVAAVSGTVSLGVHAIHGHGPASAESLGGFAFFLVHPAYLAVLLLVTASALLARRALAE